ncbi:efflux RND transporter periplasmic adaptor subunit [Vibrio sp. SCSIO 43136]|uniref:efflux RND transporter periplasmic adaptor subunit n=1 Tax=Vibrio sp. SCSIO 43136 TaxID=2819101 RepID=UPI0020765457|nr:efflux RND transporter periplasmic adaptor subunit [Vibrio sp. SCSIO 43136]USD66128.1 efflux RND transporter periplasmic adaptor subunit [Vibrio sp. SCSIO 43136]
MNKHALTIFLCAAVVSFSSPSIAKGKPGGNARAVAVVAESVAEHQISQNLSLVGKLDASQSVVLSAEVAGKVEKIAVRSNQDVKKGQLLVQIDDAKSQAALVEAKAYYQDQQRILGEFQKLLKRGAITQTEIEGQIATVNIAKARLDSAQADLNNRHIKAPFNGTIGFVDFSRGKWLNTGSELLTLDDLSLMELDLQVPERYLSQLATGMSVTAKSKAWKNEVFSGEIVGIDSRINPETLNVRVRVHFRNTARKLKPGMLMAAELGFAPISAPIIPVQALEYSGTKRFVYVIGAENKVKRTEIELGARVENQVVVNSGLNIGDKIVVQGVVNMRDGVQVKPLPQEGN